MCIFVWNTLRFDDGNVQKTSTSTILNILRSKFNGKPPPRSRITDTIMSHFIIKCVIVSKSTHFGWQEVVAVAVVVYGIFGVRVPPWIWHIRNSHESCRFSLRPPGAFRVYTLEWDGSTLFVCSITNSSWNQFIGTALSDTNRDKHVKPGWIVIANRIESIPIDWKAQNWKGKPPPAEYARKILYIISIKM